MTGQYKSRADFEKDDWRLSNPRFSEENFGKNLVLVAKIEEIAKAKGVTPGQLTLAWLLKQGPDIIPIPGTKNIKYLEQNMASLGVELTDEEEKEIRALVEAADVAGTRY
jgi:aryl-alcohol dehydrogenase-like predicted oxidoreductase